MRKKNAKAAKTAKDNLAFLVDREPVIRATR